MQKHKNKELNIEMEVMNNHRRMVRLIEYHAIFSFSKKCEKGGKSI